MTRFATACVLLALVLPAGAAETVHRLRLSQQRPPCSAPEALPITPNDPASVYTPGGTRCYGTRPPELELRLPEDRYVWLERHAPNPAAWIDLGSVIVDPRSVEEPPLGLRLTADDDGLSLETRYGDIATLTPLVRGRWLEVHAPDGQRFWVQLEDAAGTVRR